MKDKIFCFMPLFIGLMTLPFVIVTSSFAGFKSPDDGYKADIEYLSTYVQDATKNELSSRNNCENKYGLTGTALIGYLDARSDAINKAYPKSTFSCRTGSGLITDGGATFETY